MKKYFLYIIALLVLLIVLFFYFLYPKNFTVIPYDTNAVFQKAQTDVQQVIKKIHTEDPPHSPEYLNHLIEIAVLYFANKYTPYNADGAQGEGDWCGSSINKNGCAHIQQDPIYRTDSFDCNTFVQAIMAFVNANNLQEYNDNIIHINYGIAHLLANQPFTISYANRNNFISGDFNPVNEKTGRLEDVTNKGIFKKIARVTSANITRAAWFAHQTLPDLIRYNIRVIHWLDGNAMRKRFQNNYGGFFQPQLVSIDYIPKEALVIAKKSTNGNTRYEPNDRLLNQIPTPSVVEIVRDVKKWTVDHKNIQDVINSGINVSHVGLLYQHTFKNSEILYQRISCYYDDNKNKVCAVMPIICHNKNGCQETMMIAATDEFPDGYRWSYDQHLNKYYCTAENNVPAAASVLGACNRVFIEPLGAYLTTMMYDHAMIMQEDSILGINIQKILNTHH